MDTKLNIDPMRIPLSPIRSLIYKQHMQLLFLLLTSSRLHPFTKIQAKGFIYSRYSRNIKIYQSINQVYMKKRYLKRISSLWVATFQEQNPLIAERPISHFNFLRYCSCLRSFYQIGGSIHQQLKQFRSVINPLIKKKLTQVISRNYYLVYILKSRQREIKTLGRLTQTKLVNREQYLQNNPTRYMSNLKRLILCIETQVNENFKKLFQRSLKLEELSVKISLSAVKNNLNAILEVNRLISSLENLNNFELVVPDRVSQKFPLHIVGSCIIDILQELKKKSQMRKISINLDFLTEMGRNKQILFIKEIQNIIEIHKSSLNEFALGLLQLHHLTDSGLQNILECLLTCKNLKTLRLKIFKGSVNGMYQVTHFLKYYESLQVFSFEFENGQTNEKEIIQLAKTLANMEKLISLNLHFPANKFDEAMSWKMISALRDHARKGIVQLSCGNIKFLSALSTKKSVNGTPQKKTIHLESNSIQSHLEIMDFFDSQDIQLVEDLEIKSDLRYGHILQEVYIRMPFVKHLRIDGLDGLKTQLIEKMKLETLTLGIINLDYYQYLSNPNKIIVTQYQEAHLLESSKVLNVEDIKTGRLEFLENETFLDLSDDDDIRLLCENPQRIFSKKDFILKVVPGNLSTSMALKQMNQYINLEEINSIELIADSLKKEKTIPNQITFKTIFNRTINLLRLNICFQKIYNYDPENIPKDVFMNSTQVKYILACLKGLGNLKDLSLSFVPTISLSGTDLFPLYQLPKLEKLYLGLIWRSSTENIGEELLKIILSLKYLQSLEFNVPKLCAAYLIGAEELKVKLFKNIKINECFY